MNLKINFTPEHKAKLSEAIRKAHEHRNLSLNLRIEDAIKR